jgi:MFS family permease
MVIVGILTGPLFDAGFFYALLGVGSFLLVLGMYMTSICTAYWHFMLAQGICVGLGCGCLYLPSIAILPSYFTTKKAVATGIAASGGSVGGVVYTVTFASLQPNIGFRNTTIVMASIILGTMAICTAVMRVRVRPAQKRQLLDLEAFRNIPSRPLQPRTLPRLHGRLRPFLLHPVLRAREPHHELPPGLLHAGSPQRRLRLRPHRPELPRRQVWAHQRPGTLLRDLGRPRFLLDGGS